MKHPFLIVAMVVVSSTLFWACSSANVARTVSDKSNPDYYTDLGSNQQRLVALLTGVFQQRVYDTETKKEKTWLVNDNQDSIVLVSVEVGDPNKNGYWIYQYQYMTHLSDKPFFKSLINIQKIDRDTFHLVYHRPAKVYTLEEVLSEDFGKDIELENLLEGKTRVYVQSEDSRLHFEGYSAIANRKVQGGTMAFLQEKLDLTPDRLRMKLLRYKSLDPNDFIAEAKAITYFRRLDKVPGQSKKKKKK